MANYRVIQTVAAFEYPKGKIWGPYEKEEDAEKRVKLLESFDGCGLIDEGEFGEPCREVRPDYENGSEKVTD